MFSQGFWMAYYDDDCSPYESAETIDDVIRKLEHDSVALIEWYENNYLKSIPNKWHVLLSNAGNQKEFTIIVGNKCISNSSEEKILGVYFDDKLNFHVHLSKLCKRAIRKLHALARISNYMSCKQRKIIMNAFITSQFNYCPLIWMCHSRTTNAQINKIHERALRIVYADNTSSFEQLLNKSESVSIHHRNIQFLAMEIYKALNNLSSSLMSELFKTKETKYDLRKGRMIVSRNVHTTRYRIDSISYLRPRIWDQVPNDIKNSATISVFKNNIKHWIPNSRLCNIYIQNLGYI